MTKPMLACGHAANATDGAGKPACAMCVGIHSEAVIATPDLTGRMARCSCGALTPSRMDLPFFEFRGEGSRLALTSCKNCGYADVAHTPEVMEQNKNLKCQTFEPRGAWDYDSYYDGCSGWD